MAKEVSRTVTPPYTLVRFPPTYAIPEIMRSAATFGPVQGHQIFQQSGILLIRYQSDVSARASYGATLPTPCISRPEIQRMIPLRALHNV